MSAPNKSYDPVEVEALKPEEIERMRDEALAAFAAAGDLDALQQAKVAHTGGPRRSRSPTARSARCPRRPRPRPASASARPAAPSNKALAARQAELEAERDARVLVEEAVDVTLPYDRAPAGARHPLTTLMERIADVFVAMGYEVAEGPEVEAEWFNFDALNIVPGPPGPRRCRTPSSSRAPRATTATSPASCCAPTPRRCRSARCSTASRRSTSICPGRVYRTDELDATHTPVFHQIEVLAVDEGLTMADLKGTLDHMVQALFGEGMKTRLRPNYFPFTEPSAEMDMVCFVCRGESVGNPDRPCRTCWPARAGSSCGGCGMVNPRVLIACGVDPEKYSGFAFGFGIERMLMFRHNVEDMRDMVEGDVRFTRPFGMEI